MLLISPLYLQKAAQVYLPICALLAFSIEFLLKAWLIADGLSEDDVSKPHIRHDLEELLDLAKSRGLRNQHQNSAEIIAAMNAHHKKHEFRYLPAKGEFKLLNFPLAALVIEALDATVRLKTDAENVAAAVHRGEIR